MTRKEFLKICGFGILSIFMVPAIKKLQIFKKNVNHKEAKYYKTLAG